MGLPAWKAMDFPNPDYVALARACGAVGFKAEKPGELRDAISAGAQGRRPGHYRLRGSRRRIAERPASRTRRQIGQFRRGKDQGSDTRSYRRLTEHGDSAACVIASSVFSFSISAWAPVVACLPCAPRRELKKLGLARGEALGRRSCALRRRAVKPRCAAPRARASKREARMSHKILVAQGGGPTAVINQSLVGVALEARRFPDDHPRLWRAARRARHRRRGPRRSRPGDARTISRRSRATPAAALGSTRDKPDLKYCQEIFRVLQRPRDRHVPLYRRQRFLRHGAHRRRGGAQGRPSAARDPHPEDDRQRSRRLRPYAGLSLRRALRRPGFHGRQSRQQRAAGRLLRRHHGPARRLPHRRLGAGAQISRRRAAPDLSARARVRHRQVPRRREGDVTRSTAAA